MSLLDEARAMSPEEQVELGKLLQSAEIRAKHQDEEVRQLGEPMHGPGWDDRLKKYKDDGLTPVEIYVRDHPLNLRQYGYSETFASWGEPQKTKYWRKEEVDAYNEELKLRWLEEAHKVFPYVNFIFSDEQVSSTKGDA